MNLKQLNQFIILHFWKNGGLESSDSSALPGIFLSFSRSRGRIFTYSVHEDYRRFLRFRFWGQLFQFRVLSFGQLPIYLSKFCSQSSLREKRYFSIIYLDDILLIESSFRQYSQNVAASLSLLTSLGFLVNRRTYIFRLTCRFLGFIFNTIEFWISIS